MMRFDWTVTVNGVDISHLVKAGGTIDYGRPTRFTSFQAPIAVFELLTKDENPNPAPPVWPTIRLGDPVIIHVTHDGTTQHRRFTGIVQALDYSIYSLRVTATGTATDWGRSWSGYTYEITGMPIPIDLSIPVETETVRVQRWVGLAGRSVTIEGVPARWIRAVPDNTTGEPLLDVILRIADDCDGLLLEDRLGVMRYRTWNFARPARILLPAHMVEAESIDMVIERGSLINAVTVFYGEPDPTTGLQAEVYGSDQTSIGQYGKHQAEIATDIQYATGAAGKAQKYLEKNQLGWEVPDVTLLMNQATPAEADVILALQENWRVAVSPLPEGSPIGVYDGDILGFTEVMHETDYRMILHLGPPVGDEAAPPEEPIFAEDSLTGGRVEFYEDQNAHRYQVHIFDTPGDAVLTCVHPVTTDVLVAGAGGGGGGSGGSYQGGGGGAGALFYEALSFTAGTIPVTVGAHGVGTTGTSAAGTSGGTSKLGEVWCYGGGGGGRPNRGGGAGLPGGFGGGRGSDSDPAGAGTYGSLDGGVTTNTTRIKGGPGGAPSSAAGAGGGPGFIIEITGTAETYSRGGASGRDALGLTPPVGPGGGGNGGDNFQNGHDGADGIVAVAYRVG